jgi:hypothetical protein
MSEEPAGAPNRAEGLRSVTHTGSERQPARLLASLVHYKRQHPMAVLERKPPES